MGIPVLKGNAKDLIISNSIFVSEHFARETFGSADPIGKTLSADKQLELTIRGVYKDIPENSMLSRDFVITITAMVAMRVVTVGMGMISFMPLHACVMRRI